MAPKQIRTVLQNFLKKINASTFPSPQPSQQQQPQMQHPSLMPGGYMTPVSSYSGNATTSSPPMLLNNYATTPTTNQPTWVSMPCQGRPSTPVVMRGCITTSNQQSEMLNLAQQSYQPQTQVMNNHPWMATNSSSLNSQPNITTARRPGCLPESGIPTNPKYLQELEGAEFQVYAPNKRYNRKKICFEVVKDSKPKLDNRWQTEHRENFGYYTCLGASCDCGASVVVDQNTSVPFAGNVPPSTPYQYAEPAKNNNTYNPEIYQQAAAFVTNTSQAAGTTPQSNYEAAEFADAFADENNNAKSQLKKKQASLGNTSTQKKPSAETATTSQTKPEAPQLTESIERKSRGAYQNNDSNNANKKKTKQELYADVYSKTLSKIQEKEFNQKKQLMTKQDVVKAKIEEEEKLSLERNQKELNSYMNRGEKAPFFPFGYCNTTPVSDKSYMVTYNVGPRNSTQVAKDIVARRSKTHEYDGWKKLLVDQEDFKQWRPKSYYWKTFDRFDKYNHPDEERKERHSYGATEDDLKAATTTESKSKKQSKKEQDSKKTDKIVSQAVTEEQVPVSSSTIEEKGKTPNTETAVDKVATSAGHAPEDYQQQMQPPVPNGVYYSNQQQQQPFFYPAQSQTPQSGGMVQGMNANGCFDPYGQPQMAKWDTNKRAPHEGPLCNDLQGMQFAKFIPKDFSNFNPKHYKGLPTHYLNYIRPAGKITPSNDVISECFHFYD